MTFCLIREDRGGVLVDDGKLLESILAETPPPAAYQLFGTKHWGIDYWMVAKEVKTYPRSFFYQIRSFESFAIFCTLSMPQSYPDQQRLAPSYEPKRVKEAHNFHNLEYRPQWVPYWIKYVEGWDSKHCDSLFERLHGFSNRLRPFFVSRGLPAPFNGADPANCGCYHIRFHGTDEDVQRDLLQSAE